MGFGSYKDHDFNAYSTHKDYHRVADIMVGIVEQRAGRDMADSTRQLDQDTVQAIRALPAAV